MYLKVGHDGLPDRLIVFPGGAVVWAELKTDDGALTKLQESRIRDLERHGQTVAVVRGGGGVDEFVQRFFLSGEAR
jgi:hypothetical protein